MGFDCNNRTKPQGWKVGHIHVYTYRWSKIVILIVSTILEVYSTNLPDNQILVICSVYFTVLWNIVNIT